MANEQRPNILLIITDHHAYYGHYGERDGFSYRWPRWEQFCGEGTKFNRAYSVCPICTPARASMMTGEYPSRHGMVRNTEVRRHDSIIDFRQGQRLYSHHLSGQGYRNAYIGKWHCGHERLPEDYGIEGWSLPDYGKVYMSDAYERYAAERGCGPARARMEWNLNHPEWAGQTLTLHHESPWRFMNGSGVMEGPPAAHEEQFVANLSIDKLNELVTQSRDTGQPWSLVASFWGPHQAYYPTEPFAGMVDPATIPEYPSFLDDLAGRPFRHYAWREFRHTGSRAWTDWATWQEVLARAYEQGLQTDAAIGDLLDALEASGTAEDTIVLWCADHGDAIASHGGLWDKGSSFAEEVARVPMAVRWPAKVAGGREIDELVSNMDVTATMLDAAGVSPPGRMASRSLLPLCEGNADWSDELICEHNGHGDDILQRIIIHDRYKYVAALYDGDELYDLVDDPYEMKNLVDDPEHRDVKDGLRQRIIAHIECADDKRASRPEISEDFVAKA